MRTRTTARGSPREKGRRCAPSTSPAGSGARGWVSAGKTGAPRRRGYTPRRFVTLTKAAGLRQIRLHDLRHGAASLMLAAGVPMAIVSKMLRHSSIGITVDTYGHLSEDTARTASDAMAAALEQAFEITAAAAGDHTATTAAASAAEQTDQTGNPLVSTVGPVGIEPTTRGLKVRCSAD